MNQVLQSLEQALNGLDGQFLSICGMVIGVAGLCIWLGGLYWRFMIAGLLGALTGAIGGFLLLPERPEGFFIGALGGAFLGVLLRRVVLVVSAALIFGLVPVVYFLFSLEAAPAWSCVQVSQSDLAADPAGLPGRITQTINSVGQIAQWASQNTRQGLNAFTTTQWSIVGITAGVILIFGLFKARWISALGCAFLGTLMIYIGMILLLIHKGSDPLQRLANEATYYSGVFCGMVCFGTMIELIITPKPKKKVPIEEMLIKNGDKK